MISIKPQKIKRKIGDKKSKIKPKAKINQIQNAKNQKMPKIIKSLQQNLIYT